MDEVIKSATVKVAVVEGDLNDLYTAMVDAGLKELALGDIPLKFIERYLDGKRDNVAEFNVAGVVLKAFPENRESAELLRDLLTEAKQQKFLLKEIPLKHVEDYMDGNRDSLLSFTLRKNENFKE
jgi:hypothetical protein